MLNSFGDVPMCSARYLSPHNEEFMALVAEELDYKNPASREEHLNAIGRARKRYKERERISL